MSGVSPRRLREFTAAPPSSRRVTAARSPCRAAARSWALGERSWASAEWARSRPSAGANPRANFILNPIAWLNYSNHVSASMPPAFRPRNQERQTLARGTHAHFARQPSPFARRRRFLLVRPRRNRGRPGSGGQGWLHHDRRADV